MTLNARYSAFPAEPDLPEVGPYAKVSATAVLAKLIQGRLRFASGAHSAVKRHRQINEVFLLPQDAPPPRGAAAYL